jgi:hypothetical protein
MSLHSKFEAHPVGFELLKAARSFRQITNIGHESSGKTRTVRSLP